MQLNAKYLLVSELSNIEVAGLVGSINFLGDDTAGELPSLL